MTIVEFGAFAQLFVIPLVAIIAWLVRALTKNHLEHMCEALQRVEYSINRVDRNISDHILWHVEEARARTRREPLKQEFEVPNAGR